MSDEDAGAGAPRQGERAPDEARSAHDGPLRGPTFTVIAPLVGVIGFLVFLAFRGC